VRSDDTRVTARHRDSRGRHRSTDDSGASPSLHGQTIGVEPIATRRSQRMDWTLELVVVPVADVDRAKAFYIDQLGFGLDVDHSAGEDFRVVQATPPGSACSIALLKNNEMAPGTLHGLHLCVEDIVAAREQLVGHGVDASEPFHFGAAGQTPGVNPDRRSYESFLTFHDPDGNTWLVQEKHRGEPVT
jgi:catechol 2,3-dioxygenase-like lactoylglutathione lyase family enzyme